MDILFFDIESTGLSTENDRIVQLAIKVVTETGEVKVNKSKLYNPGISISETAFQTHGISDTDVADAPSFKEDARKLAKLFEDKVIVGYNIMRFDLPMIMAEFLRYGVEPKLSGKYLDVLNIEKKLNSNRLEDAYYRYTGKKLEGGHDAMKDVEATELVFNCQAKIVNDRVDMQDTDLFDLSGTKDMIDLTNKLKKDDRGYLIFNFGKAKGKRIIDDASYAKWILNENFPEQVKDMIRAEQTKHALGKKPQVTEKEAKQLMFGLPKKQYSIESKNWEPLTDDLPF